MKETFDREMDSLLRRRARGTAESRSWGNGGGDGSTDTHLDADELGAFAEGALPAAARLAAISHLADCERCRGVVVGLARASGAGAEVKHQAVAVPASVEAGRTPAWRGLIASLFAPRVMRFAVPVLALSLVGVVSYVALRSDRGAEVQMAKDTGRRPGILSEQPNASTAPNPGDANANAAGLADQNTNVASTGTSAPSTPPLAVKGGHGGTVEHPVAATDEERTDTPAEPPPPPSAAAPAEGPAAISKAAPKPVTTQPEEGEHARTDNREKSENRDKSARTPEPVDEVASTEAQQRASRSRANEVQMPDGSQRNQKRGADNNVSGGYGNVANTPAQPKESSRERAGASAEAAGRSRAPRRAEKKADEDDTSFRDGQTRSAGGHRFRREGGAWVDVNYRPSMPSTGVRRGTEPFRALVADLPEVGRVAEAINGEVIVVVGSRAYRIR